MHIFLKDLCDTAFIQDLEGDNLTALCDHINKTKKLNKNAIVRLWWTKKKSRKQKGKYIVIAKYWVTPRGVRKLRLQCHKMHDDGSWGPRQLIEERHQGIVVR